MPTAAQKGPAGEVTLRGAMGFDDMVCSAVRLMLASPAAPKTGNVAGGLRRERAFVHAHRKAALLAKRLLDVGYRDHGVDSASHVPHIVVPYLT